MSLAARCPACGTVFRVVQDQLKVSEGWVRCGRCAEVFNAAQRLFELDPDAPQEQPDAVEPHLLPPDTQALPPGGDGADAAAEAVPEPAETTELLQPYALVEPAEAAEPAKPSEPDEPAEHPAEAPAPEPVTAPPEAPSEAAPPPAAAPEPAPEFMRRAAQAERWRHPARRGALAGAALLLAALLGAQLALHYRDAVAAAWPVTQPALQVACDVLGCRIEAPRRIASLGVDSSGLVRLPDSPLYRLSLVVRNKAPTAVRMPAIDLALTDTQGQTVVRRVLTAAELGQPAEQLPAGGELALQATLDLGERRVDGYTVELFYP